MKSHKFAHIVEAGGSMRLRDLFYRRPSNPPELAPLLVADPEGPAGVGPHEALVLVHGHYWKDGAGQEFDPHERSFLFEPFKHDPRFEAVRKKFRVFTYLYPSHAAYEFSASALATALAEQLPEASGRRDLIMIAHSMGGLVARYALQLGELGERVRTLFTLATPHHGTILASLIMAHEGLKRKVGLLPYLMQRLGRRIWHPGPGMMGMAHDNYDGRIDAVEEKQMGIYVNRELARLNAADPYMDRLVCLMGRVRGWWLRGRNLWDQIPRWVLGRHDSIWYGLDPLINPESGLADGLSVRNRHAFDGLDHEGIITSGQTHDLLFEELLGDAGWEAAEGAAA